MKNNTHKINQETVIDNIDIIQQLLHITGEFVVVAEDLKAIIPIFDNSKNYRDTGQLLRQLDNKYFDPGIKKLYAVTQDLFANVGKTTLKETLESFGVPTDDLPPELLDKPLSEFQPPKNISPNN